MPIPHTPRVIYARAPLAEVIVQLRFPAILKIGTSTGADDLARFQDQIRDAYPLVLEPKLTAAQGVPLELLQSVGVPIIHAHEFVSADAHHKVSFVRNALSLSTLRYSRWELYRTQLGEIFRSFCSVYRPAFFERIGLRYRNQIDRAELGLGDMPWGELLEPIVAGPLMPGQVAPSVTSFQAETQLVLEHGDKVTLRYGLPLTSVGESSFIIDNDFYVDAKTEVDDALQVLERLHLVSGPTFRGCIQHRLHNALEPQPIE